MENIENNVCNREFLKNIESERVIAAFIYWAEKCGYDPEELLDAMEVRLKGLSHF